MSEILREFKISVGLDSSDLDKGIKKSESNLKRFATIAGSAFATFASFQALKGAISGFTELADKIGHASKMFGFSVKNTHALGNALKRFGGNTDSAIASLKSLSGALQEAKWGQGALMEVGRKYGISFAKSNGTLMKSEELLISLGKQMRGMSKDQQIEIGQKLGLDDSVILALQDGGVELENLIKRQKQLGVLTSKDYKIAQEFGDAWEELKEVFKASGYMLVRYLLPPLKGLAKLFTTIFITLRKHKAFVASFFISMGIAMTPILLMLGKMAIASATAFAPFFAIGAVITGVALALEDLWVYFKGGDSLVGEFAKKWEPLKVFLESLRVVFNDVMRIGGKLFDFFKDPSWENFKNFAKDWGDTTLKYLKMPFEWLANISDSIFDNIKSAFSNLGNQIGSTFSGILNNVKGFFGFSTPQLGAGTTSNSTTNNLTTNHNGGNNININVNGVGSPMENARQVERALTQSVFNMNQSVGSN